MPYDLKYGRVTLENQRNIGDDEPVFILRPKDKLSIPTLSTYLEFCKAAGCPANHTDGIVKLMRVFEDWQHDNGTKTPDSVGYHPSEES